MAASSTGHCFSSHVVSYPVEPVKRSHFAYPAYAMADSDDRHQPAPRNRLLNQSQSPLVYAPPFPALPIAAQQRPREAAELANNIKPR